MPFLDQVQQGEGGGQDAEQQSEAGFGEARFSLLPDQAVSLARWAKKPSS